MEGEAMHWVKLTLADEALPVVHLAHRDRARSQSLFAFSKLVAS